MTPKTAKLFMNGRSQAVRLPKAFRFEGDEALIHRDGDRVILTPELARFFQKRDPADRRFHVRAN